MRFPFRNKKILILQTFILICCTCFGNESLFRRARSLQHDGKYDEAIEAYKQYLSQSTNDEEQIKEQAAFYSESLVQLMNTYQSKGEPESCISALQEVFYASPVLQEHYLRDFYSVMGYALSRTERMTDAEEMTLKVFTIPLRHATPERYFRDYAYAAAVFYTNPHYQTEVTEWCEEALLQAEACKNTSGKQWVTAMLGSLYKKDGRLNKALKLFQQSKEEAQERNDELGVLNSLHAFIDLFLYWDVPEYANLYASEAIRVEKSMKAKNPMVSAQTYINKGRALQQLRDTDSVSFYIEKAQEFCRHLPYNSGMVDVDLLLGIHLTENDDSSLQSGIEKLQQVTRKGTVVNQAKAYHQLAQIYLRNGEHEKANIMLDDMYSLLNLGETFTYINIDYEPILNHYQKCREYDKAEKFYRLMLQEQKILKEKRLNYNLVEAIVNQQTEQQRQELKIVQLEQANQRLWFLICAILFLVIITVTVTTLVYQRKQHEIQMKHAESKLALLMQKLNQTTAEKELISQEIDEIINDKDNRQELETLTPAILQKNGESKFRQRFELLYPLFLPRLREKVPSITRREELLSMLIVLKQDNKEIAELLAIAPRSVLMLRHRFRQKIGMTSDDSLEIFIEETLGSQNKHTQ